ncbi:cellulose binding domain-containing protein [Saccharothrix texasensis]|uniref:Cellulose binding domain-containing protein n=1 Tax=Saccharothrix texasensis TaxID=103734 RepID=A0A3N1H2P3_9PSEU|nr:cellulose binding domain-containing protein [Saccharothrix texasensis]ROP36774.1 cellulose binding domain-containing protein [Saccharothrix texasensis]
MARRTPLTRLLALTTAVVAALGVVLVTAAASPATPTAAAVPEQPHTWRNVEIQGGGFVPGIVFSPAEKDLIYARTDIGGAYRWDQATGRWIPLLDWVGWDEWGYNGVASIAPDPENADKVYAAVGMYTNSWDPHNGAILRSADRGATWQRTELPFKLGGNMPGRGMGERLSVDPNDGRVLYFGAPSGKGLWRSTDSGATWSQVTSFPNPGNYVADPNDANGYANDIQGVVWVTYDPRSSTAGSATRTIYVGVADKENTVYRSTDAGATWTRLAGQPTGYIAHQGELDTKGGFLYLATSDTGGPYDGGKGDVWKYDTATGAWTRISPVPSTSADDYFGYSGLTIDRQDPDTLMVATQISWWPDIIIFRSTDGGATWTRAWDFTSYPDRSFRYTMDIRTSPWLSWGANPQPPEVTPKLGWMVESLEIDPFDSNRMMYGTGATVYGTTDLLKWDSGGQITIKPTAAGLEETAVLDLISPPAGVPLFSGLGDIGGFRHASLTTVPSMMYEQPNFTSTTSLDFAELNPQVMVRSGNVDGAAHVAFSTNGGTWFAGSEPGGVTGGGTVAAAADGSRFVWSPAGAAVHHSVGFGHTWTPSTGIPAGAVVESDRVNPNKFYGLANDTVYVSTDGGATFTAGATADVGKLHAVPGNEGHLWLVGDGGLFRSTDGGKTVTAVAGVTSGVNIGFGKAAFDKRYPSLYAVLTVDGKTGVYRSDDEAASWVRINDDRHQYGNMGEAITGDPRVYGRVYLGTNGRGILVAEPSGGTSSSNTHPTDSSSSTTTTTTTTTTTVTTVTDQPPPGCSVKYQVASQWGGGFTGSVKITNRDSRAITGWNLGWTFANGQQITNSWNGKASQSGAAVTVTNEGWNGTIGAGGSVDFGFQASWQGSNVAPTGFTLNGRSCFSG